MAKRAPHEVDRPRGEIDNPDQRICSSAQDVEGEPGNGFQDEHVAWDELPPWGQAASSENKKNIHMQESFSARSVLIKKNMLKYVKSI